ncbi:unnamed protein product [Zymoseptoria tritici ST99CH_3D7]|uniref:Uncharacterized protein n=2 Tax=Zymoseptoria tritici TaxID=1047171 RepID=A0A1X7S8D1_ZYMT9|nr:unnamed protein product [Zymoseptoria tritici ST99CH_3D7]SMR61140.1 unnamed protein product [Zymoseptoria tritici ST99CH_1E4]
MISAELLCHDPHFEGADTLIGVTAASIDDGDLTSFTNEKLSTYKPTQQAVLSRINTSNAGRSQTRNHTLSKVLNKEQATEMSFWALFGMLGMDGATESSLSRAQIAEHEGRRWNHNVEGKDKILAICELKENEGQTDKERNESSGQTVGLGRSSRRSRCRPGSFVGEIAAARPYVQSNLRRATLLFIPAPAIWINDYAASKILMKGQAVFIDAATVASSRREWWINVIANYISLPQPREDISPGMFVTASLVLIVLVCVHRRLHDQDKTCDWIMAASIGTAFAVGTWARMDTLAIVFNLIPWAAWAGCSIAEAVCAFI